MAQIRTLWRENPSYIDRKLCPSKFMFYWMTALTHLHQGQFKRATFYFPTGDENNVADHIEVPDVQLSGHADDINFKYCGQKLKKSAEFDKFVEEHVPDKFKGRFGKSEKGIDIEICCDAFKLAALGKLERLFILTNDDDFLPFFRSVKEYGANIGVLQLSAASSSNVSLLREADTFNLIPETELQRMFLPVVEETAGPNMQFLYPTLKPDAAPSDLEQSSEGDAVSESDAGSGERKGEAKLI